MRIVYSSCPTFWSFAASIPWTSWPINLSEAIVVWSPASSRKEWVRRRRFDATD